MCCQLSASARQQLAEGKLTPALSLWRDVVAADASSPYRKRLKCIMALTNPADCNLDAISSGLVKTYNAKPFMCRTTGATFWLPWPRPHNACLAPAAAVSQPTTQSPRLTTRLGQAAPSAARRVAHWSYTRLPPARSCRSCRAHDRKLRPLSSAPAPRRTGFYYKTDRYFGVEADVHKWGIMALQVRAPSSSHHHPHHLPTHAIPFLTVACTPHTIVRSPPTTHATLHRSPPSTARQGFNTLQTMIPKMVLRCGLLIQSEVRPLRHHYIAVTPPLHCCYRYVTSSFSPWCGRNSARKTVHFDT